MESERLGTGHLQGCWVKELMHHLCQMPPVEWLPPGLFQPFSAGTIGPAWVSAHTERFNSHSTRASEERILSFERIALFLPDNRGGKRLPTTYGRDLKVEINQWCCIGDEQRFDETKAFASGGYWEGKLEPRLDFGEGWRSCLVFTAKYYKYIVLYKPSLTLSLD